jgi:hypothetical protein
MASTPTVQADGLDIFANVQKERHIKTEQIPGWESLDGAAVSAVLVQPVDRGEL